MCMFVSDGANKNKYECIAMCGKLVCKRKYGGSWGMSWGMGVGGRDAKIEPYLQECRFDCAEHFQVGEPSDSIAREWTSHSLIHPVCNHCEFAGEFSRKANSYGMGQADLTKVLFSLAQKNSLMHGVAALSGLQDQRSLTFFEIQH
jgi:hypothetical protein